MSVYRCAVEHIRCVIALMSFTISLSSGLPGVLQAMLKLSFIKILRVQAVRLNGLEPFSIAVYYGPLVWLDCDEIHHIRPPSVGPFLGALGANAPERFPAG